MQVRVPLKLWRVPRWPTGAFEKRPLILLYHSIARVSADPWGIRVRPRHFAQHMAILHAHCQPMPLDRLVNGLHARDIPARAVAITFDDGFVDNLLHARPVLEMHRIPATIFVSTGYVGSSREYWWDELDRVFLQRGKLPLRLSLKIGAQMHEWELKNGQRYGALDAWRARHWRAWHETGMSQRQHMFCTIWSLLRKSTTHDREQALQQLRDWSGISPVARRNRRCVTADELKRLASDDLIEIGGHTVTHPSLGAIAPDAQRQEIVDCKAFLEATLNKQITSFSYPFGSPADFTPQTIQLLKEAGFARACVNDPRPLDPDEDCFQLPRRNVLDWPGNEFSQWLAKWFAQET